MKMLDIDKIKREEAGYQARAANVSVVNSPTLPYPSGPPPPYSHPTYSGARTPPEARRPSSEGNKQSLPSIHEALGVEQPAAYTAATHRPYSSAPQSTHHVPMTAPAPAPVSPRSNRRSFAAMDPPSQPVPFTHGPRSPYSQSHQDVSPRQVQDHHEHQRSVYASQPPPSLHPTQSPLAHQSQYPPRSYTASGPLSAHDRTASHPLSMPPVAPLPAPQQQQPLPYGYAPTAAPYPTHYAYPPSAPHPVASSSVYQPSITQPPPHQNGDPGRAPFGDSVKRHLDMWDFGEALNEVCLPKIIQVSCY
jgi:hypothetical protein